MSKRHKTKYPGVFYREAKRIGGKGIEKVFYVVFKRGGRTIEEKVGWQYANDMSPARASKIRAELIEGRRLTKKEQAQQEALRWDMDRLWAFFEEQKKGLKSFRTDSSRWHKHLQPYIGGKLVDDLVTMDVERIKQRMLKTHTPATTKHVIVLMKRMIRLGAKKGQFPLPDISRLNFEMPRVDNERTEDLTPEQLKRLLTVLNSYPNVQVANLMKLALYTGMRRGELFRLKWEHIDFQRGFIGLIDPKGGKDQRIPLNDAARVLLEEHERGSSPYVFPGRAGKQRVECKGPLRKIKKLAGLPDDFRPLHGLRHAYASMLASSGKVDMYTLQKLLTHKSAAMTGRYAHLRDEALHRAAEVASDLFASVEQEEQSGRILSIEGRKSRG